jgi:hypothetical protein
MNIASLLENTPELLSGLKGLGFDNSKISELAGEIGGQLGGADGFDITDLLSGLQSDDFLKQLDVNAISEKLLISPELAQQAVGMIAPVVANFGGGSKMGMLGKLAGGLFGRK